MKTFISFIFAFINIQLCLCHHNETNITSSSNENIIQDNNHFVIKHEMDISINKQFTTYYIHLIFNTKILLIVISVLFGIIIILSIIYSCYKVPLKSGYNPRHCMRSKYFLKAFLYILFFPCVIIYHCIFVLFKFLDGVCWDQQLEQRTLTDPNSNKSQSQIKQKQYIELSDNHEQV